eukprot:TRINITY_DN113510_c0_g1_i1.p1 TRINITY_DN113510_c0_g1~~TRINITY_DN113510_c0_g1_i1.p1  ORF type:complete len:195 (+),score=72.84 TRINITY_DN113510_c0_g1_i1:88-585(+)
MTKLQEELMAGKELVMKTLQEDKKNGERQAGENKKHFETPAQDMSVDVLLLMHRRTEENINKIEEQLKLLETARATLEKQMKGVSAKADLLEKMHVESTGKTDSIECNVHGIEEKFTSLEKNCDEGGNQLPKLLGILHGYMEQSVEILDDTKLREITNEFYDAVC